MSGAFPTPSDKVNEEKLSNDTTAFVTTTHSKRSKVAAQEGQRWFIKVGTIPLNDDDWRDLEGFFLSQQGRYDTFTYVMQTRTTPRGTNGSPGTPTVNGASQTGRSLVTDNWNNSETVLKRGDLIGFTNHTKVYMVTSDVTSDGSGNATIPIEPALVESPSDNEDLVTTSVPFTVGLAEPHDLENSLSGFGAFNILLEERF